MKYSIIVPVFNRPDEVNELLESLTHQTVKDFEVVIVEDGSQTPCKDVCEQYKDMMDIHYYYKENSGPGQAAEGADPAPDGGILLVFMVGDKDLQKQIRHSFRLIYCFVFIIWNFLDL